MEKRQHTEKRQEKIEQETRQHKEKKNKIIKNHNTAHIMYKLNEVFR